jgi:O-antigen/teichoic acid export membrane protein
MTDNREVGVVENPVLRIIRNATWSLGGKAVGAILSIVYLAAIARSLGAHDFGRFALIFSFAQLIAGLVAFPTWQILIRYGTKYVLDDVSDRFAQLVLICLAMDFAGIILGLVAATVAISVFGEGFSITGDLKLRILLFTFVLLLSARSTVIGILRAHDRFRDAALADILVPVIRFVGVVVVIFIRPNVEGFLLVWALSEILATLILWVITVRTVTLPFAAQKIAEIPLYFRSYPDLFQFVGFSSLANGLRVLGSQLIVLLVGLYTGPAAAGFFRLGSQLGQVLARISDGLSIAFYAEYSRMAHLNSDDAVAAMVSRTLKVTGFSAVVLLGILTAFGKPLIITVFGSAFAPAYPFVILLGGAAAVQLGSGALEALISAKGQTGKALLANGFGTLFLLIAVFALIADYDALGASVAVLVGALATAVCLTYFYRRSRLDQDQSAAQNADSFPPPDL